MKAKIVFHLSLGPHHLDHYVFICRAIKRFTTASDSPGIVLLWLCFSGTLPALTLIHTNTIQHPGTLVPASQQKVLSVKDLEKLILVKCK